MAGGTFDLCGLCGQPLKAWHPSLGRGYLTRTEGLLVTVGYSRGGWGHRENLIDWHDEVCGDCFDAVMTEARALAAVMDERRGAKACEPKPSTNLLTEAASNA